MRKRILCLANSRKLGGHCVAGLTGDGTFIRMCGPSGAALTDADTDLGLMDQPRLLDELDVSLQRHIPQQHQMENWLIRPGGIRVISRTASSDWANVILKAREPAPWILGSDQASVSAQAARALGRSLELIRPKNLHVRIRWRHGSRMPQFRGIFQFHGVEYDLPITDPVLERELRKDKDVLHEGMTFKFPQSAGRGALYATLSIGEEYWDGVCYKLIAALFFVPWWLERAN